MVAKMSLRMAWEGDNALDAYYSQMEVQSVAGFLADLFPKETGREGPAFEVKYLQCSTLQMTDARGKKQVCFPVLAIALLRHSFFEPPLSATRHHCLDQSSMRETVWVITLAYWVPEYGVREGEGGWGRCFTGLPVCMLP
jgi:hypothetical protein